jgi:hypothetical protein
MVHPARKAATCAAFLLAGAVLSVAVAWSLPFIAGPRKLADPIHETMSWGAAADPQNQWWLVSVLDTLPTDMQRWNWYPSREEAVHWADWYSAYGREQVQTSPRWNSVRLASFSLPYWSAIHHSDLERFDPSLVPSSSLVPADRVYTFWELAQGWPFRCVRGSQLTAIAATADVPFQTFGTYTFDPRHVIALKSIPRGLVADAAFFAFLLPVPRLTFRVIRQGYRRRHGLCIACGYDRKGIDPAADCPECGGRS